MNTAQRIAMTAYCDGEFSSPDVMETLDECGDGLFKFLMVELSDKEDCTGLEDAYKRVALSIEQLQEVLNALGVANGERVRMIQIKRENHGKN